jgi:hypothetical protein
MNYEFTDQQKNWGRQFTTIIPETQKLGANINGWIDSKKGTVTDDDLMELHAMTHETPYWDYTNNLTNWIKGGTRPNHPIDNLRVDLTPEAPTEAQPK